MFLGRKSNQYWKFLTIILLGILLVTQIKADLAPNEDDEGTNEKNDLEQKPSEDGSKAQAPKTNLGFIHAFIASFSVIIVSEIGDKTFFIAAIMSMKYPRLTVFGGAITALALMTVLSAVFGMVFIQFIPPSITRWVSVGLFVVFGLKMLHEGWKMTSTDAAEEMEEVQADIRKREDELNKDTRSSQDAEAGGARKKASPFTLLFKIFMQAFTMTFVAEWGDRSQITTIILAARENLWGVILGGIIGHSICTGLGVLGGRIIAQKISVRTVTIVGGVVFLIFAITSSIWDPNDTVGGPDTATNTGGN
ncbi:putative divalent cation/proton antiporter TMEM165 isoform X2 [Chironomus tepperi]|uniref:putative divalent cation/proton antiporter TMEM165 isoform X2 n=1 Tax=Chironomus tepperi TaxID=113505 RepID=UPI00391F88E6